MTTWISHPTAAELLGVGTTTIQRFIARGELHPRKLAPRYPSLSLGEVEGLARQRRRAEEARVRLARRRDLPRHPPPPGDHVWLTAGQAARVVGITVPGIAKRVARGTIPLTVYKGRRWFRADQMELLDRARAARRAGAIAAELSAPLPEQRLCVGRVGRAGGVEPEPGG